MKNILNKYLLAAKTVLRSRNYLVLFLLFIPTISFLLYLIPVTKVPGNSIAFQAKLFGTDDFILLVILAALESLLLTMFFYAFSRDKHRKTKIGKGPLGFLSVIPAFLFGTKICPMCIAVMLGVFGPGFVLAALHYRNWIFLASMAVLLISIYSVSGKVNGMCKACRSR